MKKVINKDIKDIIEVFKKVVDNKPDFFQMYDDVRMMKFKIRPIQGDVATLDFNNKKFIETLWSLGKLEEIYYQQMSHLSEKDKKLFINIFDNVYQNYKTNLNKVNMSTLGIKKKQTLEMEIFKEKIIKN